MRNSSGGYSVAKSAVENGSEIHILQEKKSDKIRNDLRQMKKGFFKKMLLATLLICIAASCALFCGCFGSVGYDSPRSGKSDKTIGSFDDEFVTPSVG